MTSARLSGLLRTRLRRAFRGLPGGAGRAARISFARRTEGAVTMYFALAIIPMLGLLGAAVDFSGAQTQRSFLNSAADSAVLTAVGAPARSLSAEAAKERAEQAFKSNVASNSQIALSEVVATVVDTHGDRTVTLSYSADYKTTFAGLLGVQHLAISNTVTARGPLAPYIDFYLLLDNSPSMGLGATIPDIDKLVANTSDKCAFACHQMDNPTGDYYSLAKKLGVTLRIDVVRQATQSLMDTASLTQIRADQFGMAIYTFGAQAEKQELTEIQALSHNLPAAKTAAAGIDLMTIPYQNYRGDTQTNFDKVFEDIRKKIGTPGDGLTPSKPQKVLFFVSDGVNDANKEKCSRNLIYSGDSKTNKSYSRCMEPISGETCEEIKERGVKIAVLYTTYFPLPTNGFYNAFIKPFQPTIGDKMKACATDGLYFEVSPSDGITEAMNALFKKTISQVSLTK